MFLSSLKLLAQFSFSFFGFLKQQRNLQKGCQDLPRPDLENGQEAGAKQQEVQLSSNWNCLGGCHGGCAAKACAV